MEDEIDFLKLPIEDRCQHKLWKARVSGYEDALKLFETQADEKSPEFSKYLGLIKKFVTDSNAAAQEKGIAATLAFVENAACAGKTCGEVTSNIVTKGLAAPRTKTKELSLELVLMYVEIEKQDVVQEELIKGLENKTPKVVAACVVALREALRAFGSQVITLKPLVRILSKLLEDRDKGIRDESKQLCVEIYRWAGEAIKPQLQSLKPVTLTELESEFQKVQGERPVPTRFLKSQQEKMAKITADVGEVATEAPTEIVYVPPAVDPYDFMTPIDVLSKLPKDFYDLCEAKKWQDRKEVLESLYQLTTNVKLEPGDYGELVRTLKKMIAKDTNVLVVALACKGLTNLVLGLRKKFQPYYSQCVPVVLEKFKEKKQNVVTALRECIDAIYDISSLDVLLEDIQAALANKNPQIKSETAAFLSRCFSTCNAVQLNKKLLKPLCACLVKTLNDTDVTVRENAAEALGTALKVAGERVMVPFLQEVDALKMAKVKECCQKAVISAKPQTAEDIEKQPTPTTEKPVPLSKPKASVKPVPTAKKTASGPSTKPKAVSIARPVKSGASKKATGGGSADAPEPEFIEKDLSEEDVMTQAMTILPDDVINGLSNSNWKERLAAAEKFYEIVQQTEKGNIPAQALVKLLTKKPGFKENNFQILKLRFEILTYIADNAPISHCTIDCCLSDIVDKIGDIKTGASAGASLSSLASATSLEYISLEVLNLAFAQKNPRNQAEALIWLSTAVKQFGLKIHVKDVIDHLKKAFSSTNPTVKTSALTLVGTLYMYVGKTLRTFFDDEKPALLQLIDAELEKAKDLKPPLPERGLKDHNFGPEGDGPKKGTQVNLADLIPRVDISNQVTSQICSDLSDKDWHLRLDALQKISTIISEAKFITPNLGDLPTVLKPRLTDTNKKLATQALGLCQALGTALGSHCTKQIRNFSPGILAALGDNKANVRACALQCLNSWMENCPLPALFEGETVSDALKTDNPFLRIELFSWLTEKMTVNTPVPASELSLCLPCLFGCLEDRNVDVRKKAFECLLPFMTHLGYEPMARAASKMKPASKANIMSQLEKTRPNLPEKPSKQKSGKVASGSGRGSPPSPVGGGADEDTAVPAVKGKLNRSTSKTKLALKSNTATSKSKKEEDVDTSPPLAINNLKDQRVIDDRALKILRWNFTSPREEFYAQLKEHMTVANWGRTLIVYCFHNDFKFHLKALDIFMECIGSSMDATIANLDLILKWLALRFFDTNPSVLMRGIEYLQMLFEELSAQRYKIVDLEASSFLPYLILKIGDPKDPVRKGVKEIIKLMNKVYPSSKVFAYILQGLSSKNARMRAECLDELGIMIELYGFSVYQPIPNGPIKEPLKEIARQISDRDNAVRNAALNCIVQAYFIEGEKVYKHIGNLVEKDKSLLEERIKRASKSRPLNKLKETLNESNVPTHQTSRISPPMQHHHVQEEPENRPNKASQRPRSKGPLTLDVDDIEQMFRPKEPEVRVPDPVLVDADEILNLPDIQLPPTRLRPPASAVKLLNNSAEADTAVNLVISQLTVQEIPVVVEAFAQVEELLRQDDRAEALLGTRVDQLLVMSAVQYRFAHNKHMADENVCKADVIRLYRCVTMALVSLFDHPTLAKQASRDVLRDLIPHLVTVILDNRLNELQEGPQVVRTINLLIIRILQRSDPTNIMSALIKLLHDCVGNNSIDRFTDLIMKCLWKMIRMIQQYIDQLNVDRILLDLHVFLKAYPSSSWKERPTDTPIRTVKTILYTIVDILGESIMKHLMLIPNKQESDLYSYLLKLLKMRKEKGVRSTSAKSSQNENSEEKDNLKRSKSASLKLSKSTHEALTEIFKKIGSKEQTKDGLHELYDFMNRHPEANIEPFLQRSSDFFQNYIRQGIKEIENERKGLHKSSLDSPDVVPKSADSPRIWENSNDSVFLRKHAFSDQSIDNEKRSTESWRDTFPQLPPFSSDTTPSDLGEWLKIVVARMGLDTTQYNNPEVMNAILGIKPDVEEELYTEKEMADTMLNVKRLKEMAEALTNEVNN